MRGDTHGGFGGRAEETDRLKGQHRASARPYLVLVSGTRAHAEQIRDQVAAVLAPMGLRLSEQKTVITHIDEGLEFLGWRIQRHRKRGTTRHYVYTYPSRKAVKAVTGRIRMLSRQVDINQPLDVLLRQVNSALKGWCAYFQSGVSRATFDYVSHRAWQRVIGWLRRKHRRSTWKDLRRRYCAGGWWPAGEKASLFDPAAVRIKRYRYRGDTGIPSPWPSTR